MLSLVQKLRALVVRVLDPWDCKDSAFIGKLRFVIAEQLELRGDNISAFLFLSLIAVNHSSPYQAGLILSLYFHSCKATSLARISPVRNRRLVVRSWFPGRGIGLPGRESLFGTVPFQKTFRYQAAAPNYPRFLPIQGLSLPCCCGTLCELFLLRFCRRSILL